jgi:hypothetical protein
MTAIRRILILIVLTTAVIAGASVPAWAIYSTSTALPATTILTPTVEPPTQVEAKAICTTTVDPTTGATTTTVQAKVEWHRSTTVGVSGYRVTVHLANGTSSVVTQTSAAVEEIFANVTPAYLSQQPRYSITTLTSYGWTALSAKTGVLSC